MLKGTFFDIRKISEITETGKERYRIAVSLNPGHPIYEGHFPGNPIVPGVCQIRMITEILSEIRQKELRVLEADNIKFLSVIRPGEHPELLVECTLQPLEGNRFRVDASISAGEHTFCKYKSIVA